MGRSFAVVGAGPSGLYAVQALKEKLPSCAIDVFDKLPSPFGLIRGGIAPDHQSTKKISRTFDNILQAGGVRFLGNVAIGSDIRLSELGAIYNAVILAYGAPFDNRLRIPGEDKINVFGSNQFVGWYNSHPDYAGCNPDFATKSAVVIGAGNVAIDVARVLAKSKPEMATSDISPEIAELIANSSLEDIHIFGRRGPLDAAFTNIELRELGELTDCAPVVDPKHLDFDIGAIPNDDKASRVKVQNCLTLKSFTGAHSQGKRRRIHIHFYAAPIEILGGKQVEAIRMQHMKLENGLCVGTGEHFLVNCGLIVTCIGSHARPIDGEPFNSRQGVVEHINGKLQAGLYAVGWAKRGATGTLGTNRTDAFDVADLIVAEAISNRAGGPQQFDALARTRNVRVVNYSDWQKLDRAEIEAASPGAPRRKFSRITQMLNVLEQLEPAYS